MHILFLTDNFPPEVNAPATRTYEHCREWVRMGEKVTIITCAPNFPKGKVYDGYKNKLWQSEDMNGIRVIRVWTYITANEGFVRRILDYVSFMISAVIAALFVRRVDLVVGTSPQFFTACAAYIVASYKFVPFVFELRDIWPESIKAVGAMKESAAIRWLERIEMFLYRRASRIVSVTNSFKQILIERGIDGEKIDVITNGVDLTRFQPISKDGALEHELKLEGKFVAGYIGTHGMAHSLETLLEAAQKLAAMPDGDKFHILFLGDGARKRKTVEQARDMGLENVTFVDSVQKSEVVRYWSLLDVSIIHLKKNKLFTTVIPSKLFECMGMGIPVLHGVVGESAQIVEKEKVGLLFEPENADALVEKLRRLEKDKSLYEKLRVASIEAAKRYDRKVLAMQMLDILKNTISTIRDINK
jgi:glycosyltransferase involved in cell wall biosynthesis